MKFHYAVVNRNNSEDIPIQSKNIATSDKKPFGGFTFEAGAKSHANAERKAKELEEKDYEIETFQIAEDGDKVKILAANKFCVLYDSLGVVRNIKSDGSCNIVMASWELESHLSRIGALTMNPKYDGVHDIVLYNWRDEEL